MDASVLQNALESLVDWAVSSDPNDVKNYIKKIRSENPNFTQRQMAEVIVNDQSLNSGLLGAVTGLGGLITLPATIPIDLIKAWKIQAFMICCIAHLYGYHSQDADSRKTDIFLVLSNGSLEGLKTFVIEEAVKSAPKHALKALDGMKKYAFNNVFNAAAKPVTKYAAKAIAKHGGKKLVKYTVKGVSKHLIKALWKVGGRKAVEKSLQKAISKAVPVIGAVIGGGLDWWVAKAVGNLAIEYYENSGPEWVNQVFGLCAEE